MIELFYSNDPFTADGLVDDIQGMLKVELRLQAGLFPIEERGIEFEDDEEFNRFVKLVANLLNNTRSWRNNGFTPSELRGITDKCRPSDKIKVPKKEPIVKHTNGKVRRNDPCPCGTGKKYKKCCL